MKQSEFVRWLMNQNVVFKEGTKHIKLYCDGRQTTLPRHPNQELGISLINRIKKQLKLK
jgi:mRNA interferase HicA